MIGRSLISVFSCGKVSGLGDADGKVVGLGDGATSADVIVAARVMAVTIGRTVCVGVVDGAG